MRQSKNRQHTTSPIEYEKQKYNPNKMPLRFSFRFLVNNSKYDYQGLEKEHKVALINTIYQLSNYSWSELRHNDRHKSGYEKIAESSLKFTLPNDVPDDCSIIAFRYYDLAAMIGYISSWGTFYIIALDRNYKAYKH